MVEKHCPLVHWQRSPKNNNSCQRPFTLTVIHNDVNSSVGVDRCFHNLGAINNLSDDKTTNITQTDTISICDVGIETVNARCHVTNNSRNQNWPRLRRQRHEFPQQRQRPDECFLISHAKRFRCGKKKKSKFVR